MDESIFKAFIDTLSKLMNEQPFALYMDQLSVHKMKAVKEYMQERNIFPIYNIPAQPDLNAIESVFS